MNPQLASRAAIHEAGHAVVYLARGHAVHSASVVAADGEDGLAQVAQGGTVLRRQRFTSPNPLARLQNEHSASESEQILAEHDLETANDFLGSAAGCVAGEVAERLAFGEALEAGLDRDREQLADHILAGPDEATQNQIVHDAYTLAGEILTARWAHVLALATELDRRQTLTGAEITQVIAASG